MDFERQLREFLDLFEPYAKKYFEGRQKSVSNYPKLIGQFYRDLADFTAGGKKLRGFLVYLGYAIGAKKHLRGGKGNLLKILPVVLAVEIVHSFLLIHDDVIDQSEMRRGKMAIHKKYAKLISGHYGISQAIIIGDIACFEAIRLIAEADLDDKNKIICIDKLLQTLLETGYGQALDVEYSHVGATFDRIWEVTNLKTARYSFVGPLTLGAMLAGAKKSKIDHLGEFGLTLGTVFQIQDDILGVFGKEEALGKSVLSDMREGKNTVLIYKTKEMATLLQRRLLERLWGNPKSDMGDFKKVRIIMEKSGAKKWCEDKMLDHVKSAKKSIGKITNDAKLQATLSQLADFVTERES